MPNTFPERKLDTMSEQITNKLPKTLVILEEEYMDKKQSRYLEKIIGTWAKKVIILSPSNTNSTMYIKSKEEY